MEDRCDYTYTFSSRLIETYLELLSILVKSSGSWNPCRYNKNPSFQCARPSVMHVVRVRSSLSGTHMVLAGTGISIQKHKLDVRG